MDEFDRMISSAFVNKLKMKTNVQTALWTLGHADDLNMAEWKISKSEDSVANLQGFEER